MPRPARVLLVDHQDSFVFNLARYFLNLGCQARVFRAGQQPPADIIQRNYDLLVLSPGPCRPAEAGTSSLVRELAGRMPILGVCLGHQVIAETFGAQVVRSSSPCHGESTPMFHDGLVEFTRLCCPLIVGRYHSLEVQRESLPAELSVSGWLADGTVMAIRHVSLPIVGWQFHPESVLTPDGEKLLAAFLDWALRRHFVAEEIVTNPAETRRTPAAANEKPRITRPDQDRSP